MPVWKFVKFTEGRFVSVGASARTLVVALLLGLWSMANIGVKDTTASCFYIDGFVRFTADRKHFLAPCAFVSRVTDGVVADILDDPRVSLRRD